MWGVGFCHLPDYHIVLKLKTFLFLLAAKYGKKVAVLDYVSPSTKGLN